MALFATDEMSKKTKKSKGERLGWLPMDAIKEIVLTTDMLTGKMVKLPECKCGKCSMCKNVKFID